MITFWSFYLNPYFDWKSRDGTLCLSLGRSLALSSGQSPLSVGHSPRLSTVCALCSSSTQPVVRLSTSLGILWRNLLSGGGHPHPDTKRPLCKIPFHFRLKWLIFYWNCESTCKKHVKAQMKRINWCKLLVDVNDSSYLMNEANKSRMLALGSYSPCYRAVNIRLIVNDSH